MEYLFFCRYKFPSVLVVYQNITMCMYAIFVLIGYAAKEDLFCSSIDLTRSFDDPTLFCTITGMYTSVTAITIIKFCRSWTVFHHDKVSRSIHAYSSKGKHTRSISESNHYVWNPITYNIASYYCACIYTGTFM